MLDKHFDGIIFDMDGTIWDTVDVTVSNWQKTLSAHKELTRTITEEDMRGVMGLQLPEIGERFFPDLSEARRKELMEECCKGDNEILRTHGGKLYPGVEETIKELSKTKKLFIVSNCQEGYIEAFYEGNKMEKYFVDFENPGRTGLSKGENIKLIIERNNLKNAVYVGDTQKDYDSTKAAGIPFIYASYGFGEVNGYDIKIDSFKELLDVIK